MRGNLIRTMILAATGIVVAGQAVPAQRRDRLSPELVAQRLATEKDLESIAIIERKLMVPMRDGKRMATDVYRPKDTSRKYPTIFVRTPYNFNYWDVRNGAPGDMTTQMDAVKRGYAYVLMNERGHFFSEGDYDILGPPRTDGSPGPTARSAPSVAPRRPNGRWESLRSAIRRMQP
jgi:predicted acyl esterase